MLSVAYRPRPSWRARLKTAPATELLTVDELRAHARLADNEPEAQLESVITTARLQAEAFTNRAFITQTWTLTGDQWPEDGRVHMRPAPFQSVSEVRVYDSDNVAAVQASTKYWTRDETLVVDGVDDPGLDATGIEIDVVAGYGDAVADVPEPIVQAVRMFAAHLVEAREAVDPEGAGQVEPFGFASLLAPYRVMRL